MHPVFRRLQSTYRIQLEDEDESTGSKIPKFKPITIEIYRDIAKDNQSLLFEYKILCAHLLKQFSTHKIDEKILVQSSCELLAIADLLEILFRDYLGNAEEAKKFRTDQNDLISFLKTTTITGLPPLPTKDEYGFTNIPILVQNGTEHVNVIRRFIGRARRFLVAVADFTTRIKQQYTHAIHAIDLIASPVLDYLSWILFLPRLLINSFDSFRILITWPWMNAKERELGLQARLFVELNRTWINQLHDIGWLISGTVLCFVLTGALAAHSIYIAVAMQAFEVIVSSCRALIEISRLNTLYAQYENMRNASDPNPDEKTSMWNASDLAEDERTNLNEQQQLMDEEIRGIKFRLYQRITSRFVLLIGIMMAIPPLAAMHPLISLIGATIGVMTFLVSFAVTFTIDRKKPPLDTSLARLKFGLFKPESPPDSEPPPLIPVAHSSAPG